MTMSSWGHQRPFHDLLNFSQLQFEYLKRERFLVIERKSLFIDITIILSLSYHFITYYNHYLWNNRTFNSENLLFKLILIKWSCFFSTSWIFFNNLIYIYFKICVKISYQFFLPLIATFLPVHRWKVLHEQLKYMNISVFTSV